jgi:hypothetical protein
VPKIVRTETVRGKSWDDEDIVDINADLAPQFGIGERVVVITEEEYKRLKSLDVAEGVPYEFSVGQHVRIHSCLSDDEADGMTGVVVSDKGHGEMRYIVKFDVQPKTYQEETSYFSAEELELIKED